MIRPDRLMLQIALALVVGVFALGGGRASAQALSAAVADCAEPAAVAPLYPGAPAGPFGIAVKRPVFGGACKVCPWGAVAEIVRDAMKPYGWDVQICYHCARADAP